MDVNDLDDVIEVSLTDDNDSERPVKKVKTRPDLPNCKYTTFVSAHFSNTVAPFNF